MIEDFDDNEEFDDDEWEDDLVNDLNGDDLDDEFTDEEIAEIKRAEQDANMGFTYTHTYIDGKSALKCNKCGRTAELGDRPFPHRFDCPMRR
jgi:hypothetical protein